MAKTVGAAFAKFCSDFVDLEETQVTRARASRDAMIERINGLSNFFPLYSQQHMQFGSFARKTKIRPIDDIDLIICMSGGDLVIADERSWSDIRLKLKNMQSFFKPFCDSTNYNPYIGQGTLYLNSNKVKNKFKSALEALHDCRKAELHSNQEAVTLQFSSYCWNFDIVPAFYVESNGESYYLIPNGHGGWKKTNPKKDRENVTLTNARTRGEALKLIRLVKYWNKRHTMPSMPSYALETLVINFCNSKAIYEKTRLNFQNFLFYLYQNVGGPIQDPKGIQGNINTLNLSQIHAIRQRAMMDYRNALDACGYEAKGQHSLAINIWRKVFGNDFPTYG